MNSTITQNEANQRLDRFCRKYFKKHPEIGLGDIFSRIRKGAIKVNGRKRKSDYRLQLGDQVTWDKKTQTTKSALGLTATKKEKIADMEITSISVYIIAEDDNRLVFNKPAGVVMHPGNKHSTDITMHDMMKSYLKQTQQLHASETFSPSFCFRLDKDTSGVLIAAKNYDSLQTLNELIRERKVSKQYHTIVAGSMQKNYENTAPLFVGFDKKSGKAKTFINKEKGKESYSMFEPVTEFNNKHLGPCTLVRVQIKTGRMHQIRVHSADLGFPIIGDISYGKPVINRIATKKCGITRQLLHSSCYGFFDPFLDKQVNFSAPLPQSFSNLEN